VIVFREEYNDNLQFENEYSIKKRYFLESCLSYAIYDFIELCEQEPDRIKKYNKQKLTEIANESFLPQKSRLKTREFMQNPDDELLKDISHLLIAYYKPRKVNFKYNQTFNEI
jgi:hypothetical protein